MRKLWGDDIIKLTHLNIHKDWSRNVFRKKLEISKCHNFLISYPIFIIFAPICREIFTAFFWNYGDSGLDFPFKYKTKVNTWDNRLKLMSWPGRFQCKLLLIYAKILYARRFHDSSGVCGINSFEFGYGCFQNPGFRMSYRPHQCGWMVKTHAYSCLHCLFENGLFIPFDLCDKTLPHIMFTPSQ